MTESKKDFSKNIIKLLIKIVVVMLLFYVVFWVIFGLKRMNNDNMKPNIKEGDLLLYYRINSDYSINDVVIVNIDGKYSVKRIVAKEKDIIDIKEKYLYLNGHRIDNDMYYPVKKTKRISYPYTVKANHYFVVNDNIENKNDSRTYGAISKNNIVGIVIAKLQVRNF